MNTILIVEDELIVAKDIRRTLEKAGYKVVGVAQTVDRAMAIVQTSRPSLVLIDIFLKGDMTGIDLALQLNAEGIPFIYVSANSNQPILEAVKQTNPYGFIVKPFREKDLLITLDIARYRYENNRQLIAATTGRQAQLNETGEGPGLAAELARNKRSLAFPGLIGKSPLMLKVFDLMEQVAPYDTSVLLLGESGTGKEVVANCICQLSPRSGKPFIKINCAAIPDGLMEAELFGYEKGSFTGALDRKPGKFELAAGGTVLLDEIGEMPLDMQAKLLRVLQEKEVQRIGSSHPQKIDIRILAATNQSLEKQIGAGKFRLDLYYRLLVFPILLPPLRDRKEDIPLLLQYFVESYSRQMQKRINKVDEDSVRRLTRYNWPGNVRELQHLIERSILMTNDNVSGTLHIPVPEALPMPAAKAENKKPHNSKPSGEMEREHILAALQQSHFKITGKGGAAALLNISAATLRNRIKKLGIRISYLPDDE